ncbi:hypothetical protein [Clostridium butyricum]|uniref:hypothetical protein n=1 Tax=Clostridium butyricum TaxID=1492 RepID=UPI002ABE158E|nr:hypothetical protein [Clostridium butyricum]
MKCCVCKNEYTLGLRICNECLNLTKSNGSDERIATLVQALKLSIRHIDHRSNLSDEEFKNYIKTILKVY